MNEVKALKEESDKASIVAKRCNGASLFFAIFCGTITLAATIALPVLTFGVGLLTLSPVLSTVLTSACGGGTAVFLAQTGVIAGAIHKENVVQKDMQTAVDQIPLHAQAKEESRCQLGAEKSSFDQLAAAIRGTKEAVAALSAVSTDTYNLVDLRLSLLDARKGRCKIPLTDEVVHTLTQANIGRNRLIAEWLTTTESADTNSCARLFTLNLDDPETRSKVAELWNCLSPESKADVLTAKVQPYSGSSQLFWQVLLSPRDKNVRQLASILEDGPLYEIAQKDGGFAKLSRSDYEACRVSDESYLEIRRKNGQILIAKLHKMITERKSKTGIYKFLTATDQFHPLCGIFLLGPGAIRHLHTLLKQSGFAYDDFLQLCIGATGTFHAENASLISCIMSSYSRNDIPEKSLLDFFLGEALEVGATLELAPTAIRSSVVDVCRSTLKLHPAPTEGEEDPWRYLRERFPDVADA
ncbi:MAG: hypothetical protein LBH53_03405 [Puniceicoccales bacterium]|nr:hypothetical protein [Puniceicoccales bacterium]